MTSFRWVIGAAVLAGAVGCGDDGTAGTPLSPGISGAALAGRIEVVVVDEDTRALLERADVAVITASGSVARPDIAGRVVIEDPQLTGAVTVEVRTEDAWAGVTRWVGVASDHVVIPIPRAATERTIEGRVIGADALGAARVLVGPLVTPRFTRPSTMDRAWPADCIDESAGTCRFQARVPAGAAHLAATLRSAEGTAIAFGVAPIGEGDALEISMSDPATRAAAVDLEIAGPLPQLPGGVDAIVGVPGLSAASGIAFLPQASDVGDRLTVPELAGTLADASWWIFLEAYAEDGSARSVVLQRHLRSPQVGRLQDFLPLPEVQVASGAIDLVSAPANTFVVVECSADAGVVTTLFFAPVAGPIAEDCPRTVRVSAVEASGASGSAVDLDAIERVASRFSEVTIAR